MQKTRPIWTSEEIKYVTNNLEKMPTSSMAKNINRSSHAIQHKMNRLEIGINEIRDKPLKIKITKDFAYVFGSLLGDGSIKCYEKETYRTSRILFRVIDKDFANSVKNSMDKCFRERERIKFTYDKNRNDYVIRFAHKKICKWLLFYNIKNMLKYNEKIKISFLRGLYDAEGCVNIKNKNGFKVINYISFTNTNKKILKVTSEILKELRIEHSICKKWQREEKNFKKCYVIYICGKQNFIKFYKKIGFNIKRKDERLKYLPRDHNDKTWHKRLSLNAISRPRDNLGRYVTGQ
jgi:DNA gyrase/topoisomerase IV subunit A